MKKILICLYAYKPFENANTNVVMPLIKKLAEEYEIHILTKNKSGKALQYEIIDSVHVYRYRASTKIISLVQRISEIDKKKKKSWYKHCIAFLFTDICRALCRTPIFRKKELSSIIRLFSQNEYSLVLTTCESFTSLENMLEIKDMNKLVSPWIVYFMDPHSKYITNREYHGEVLEKEIRIYKECDLALVTQEIFDENHSNEFSTYLNKTIPIPYGNFRLIDLPLRNDIFITNKINCVYVGSLIDERIRSPQYLFRLIDMMDDGFVFHFICNSINPETKLIFEHNVKNKQRVVWHSRLPLEDCLGVMCHADCLINLGNKSINQTPSKIFDYIGTGRPIVNLYSLPEDTSKKYLKEYPLVQNIFENDLEIAENAKMMTRFCICNKGKKVEMSTITEQYKEYDCDLVAANTVDIIRRYMK